MAGMEKKRVAGNYCDGAAGRQDPSRPSPRVPIWVIRSSGRVKHPLVQEVKETTGIWIKNIRYFHERAAVVY